MGGRSELAHRAVWIHKYGPISPEADCAHLCNNKLCVNVNHLALMSHWANENYPLNWPKGKLKLKGGQKKRKGKAKRKTP